ncbi:Triacylglycerol lipase [Rhodocyclaceae bacterium]|nr:Triacylglycerol lipase [Rhodocyclaceae bacterium]
MGRANTIGPTKLMRGMLLGEAVFYVFAGLGFARLGADAGSIALLLLTMAATGRGLVILTTYAYAHAFRTPVPPECRIGRLDTFVMMAEEYLSFVLLFTIVQPFERLFATPDRLAPPAGGGLPVLLVHGYQCNRGFWFWQRHALLRAGRTVATVNLEPVFASIDHYGEQLHRRIEEICAATGAEQVILVGHSMGGLAARAYLRAHGNGRVAKLVTLASPHFGTRLAMLGLGTEAGQMVPGNDWLTTLNDQEDEALPAATVAAWSPYDNFVMPQDNALLPIRDTRNLGPIGHLAMAFSPAVTQLLLKETAPSA